MIDLPSEIKAQVEVSKDPKMLIDAIQAALYEVSPYNMHPVSWVRWVHIDRVKPNGYNPNSVANIEMRLLFISIAHDGYTQPVVTVYDPDNDTYVIVDSFHRYFTMLTNQAIYDTTGGYLPIVVIKKDINDRMASTVRHNRARGKHSISGMSSMVFSMLENGWEDAAICNELGMEPEELLRLKHITGFSKLFEDAQYSKAWKTKNQILLEREWKLKQNVL